MLEKNRKKMSPFIKKWSYYHMINAKETYKLITKQCCLRRKNENNRKRPNNQKKSFFSFLSFPIWQFIQVKLNWKKNLWKKNLIISASIIFSFFHFFFKDKIFMNFLVVLQQYIYLLWMSSRCTNCSSLSVCLFPP